MNREISEGGFTLIEAVVSIAILGLALTVLIGLETSYVDRYFEQRMNTKAAFYARYIMTMLEIEEELPEPGSSNDLLRDQLSEFGYFDYEPENQKIDERDALGSSWKSEINVESVDIPLGTESFSDILRHITVKVSWAEQKHYTLELYKFNKEALSTSTP